MKLGTFSISLTVKDMEASRSFYEKLGFEQVMGDGQKWLIMRSDDTTIGLFHGLFDRNALTFNPGWNSRAEPLSEYTDVREIQKSLKAQGITLDTEADESSTGPASFSLKDPDGNPILFDQHVG